MGATVGRLLAGLMCIPLLAVPARARASTGSGSGSSEAAPVVVSTPAGPATVMMTTRGLGDSSSPTASEAETAIHLGTATGGAPGGILAQPGFDISAADPGSYLGARSAHPAPAAASSGDRAPTPATAPATSIMMFAPYPYFGDTDQGYASRIPSSTFCHGTPPHQHCDTPLGNRPHRYHLVSGRVTADGAYLGKHAWGGLDGRIDLWRMGASLDLSWLMTRGGHGSTLLGTFDADFAVVLRPRVIWRVGGGIADIENGRRIGAPSIDLPNVTTSMDLFPFKPVVLSGRVDYGRLWGVTLVHARATAGVMCPHGIEVYAGYDFRRLGAVDLQGPIAGLRYWF